MMSQKQSFKLIKLILILTWTLAFLGVSAWIFTQNQETASNNTVNTGLINTGAININGDVLITDMAEK